MGLGSGVLLIYLRVVGGDSDGGFFGVGVCCDGEIFAGP